MRRKGEEQYVRHCRVLDSETVSNQDQSYIEAMTWLHTVGG